MTFKLKNAVNTIIFNTLIYKLNIITKSLSNAVKKKHDQHLSNLGRKNDCSFTNDVFKVVQSTAHNFPPHSLTWEKQIAL